MEVRGTAGQLNWCTPGHCPTVPGVCYRSMIVELWMYIVIWSKYLEPEDVDCCDISQVFQQYSTNALYWLESLHSLIMCTVQISRWYRSIMVRKRQRETNIGTFREDQMRRALLHVENGHSIRKSAAMTGITKVDSLLIVEEGEKQRWSNNETSSKLWVLAHLTGIHCPRRRYNCGVCCHMLSNEFWIIETWHAKTRIWSCGEK